MLAATYLIPYYSPLMLIVLTYISTTVLMFMVFNVLNSFTLKSTTNTSYGTVLFFLLNIIFFLNLAGLPPLPGFFIKLNLLLYILSNFNLLLIIILIIINFTIFYFYIQFYKTIKNYGKIKFININRRSTTLVVFSLTVVLLCYPLYNMLTIII
jgi:NADH:ubiquinone oxidoreductase subunit 2 (subunit N)